MVDIQFQCTFWLVVYRWLLENIFSCAFCCKKNRSLWSEFWNTRRWASALSFTRHWGKSSNNACITCKSLCLHTHIHPFNGPLPGTTRVSRYQKGKTNLDFTEARDSEWQWHQLGCIQVCTSLQTDNHASTPPLSFLQAVCPSCRPTNSYRGCPRKRAVKWVCVYGW